MNAGLEAAKETGEVFKAEWRRSLSGRALALLGLYVVFTALCLLIVGSLARKLQDTADAQIAQGADPEAVRRVLDQGQAQLLEKVFHADSETARATLALIPVVVLLVLRITLIFLPIYIALMGFDQMSGEMTHRSIRFVAVRARRGSILMGKFLGQAAVLAGLVTVVDLGVVAYTKAFFPAFELGAAAGALLRLWLAAVVFSLAYVALTSLCSTVARRPAVSLLLNIAVLFLFWIVEFAGYAAAEGTSPLRFLRFVSPSHYTQDLFIASPAAFAGTFGIYVAYGALFLAVAHITLRRRDL